jgi:hypothetical protein
MRNKISYIYLNVPQCARDGHCHNSILGDDVVGCVEQVLNLGGDVRVVAGGGGCLVLVQGGGDAQGAGDHPPGGGG